MDYAKLGQSGLTVSRTCLGGNSWGTAGHRDWSAFSTQASLPFFRCALDLGINFFDTADIYTVGASEAAIGAGLVGSVSRSNLVIGNRVGMQSSGTSGDGGPGRKHVMGSIDASLRRLQTDYVDVYVLHRYDATTPVNESLQTLADIVRTGKARYLAASMMQVTHLARLQDLYDRINRGEGADMIALCLEEGIVLMPYRPLARGSLAGARRAIGRCARGRAGQARLNLATASARFGNTRRGRDETHADRRCGRLSHAQTKFGTSGRAGGLLAIDGQRGSSRMATRGRHR